MNKLILLILTMFFFENLLSQELNYYYVRIIDKNIIPVTTAIEPKTKFLKMESKDKKMNNLLEKYNIKQFK